MVASAELPALVKLGNQHRFEIHRVIFVARHEIEADPQGEQPGRFGFDAAEFELHVAETHVALGDFIRSTIHARASLEHTTIGGPAWTAAMLVLSISEAHRNNTDQATDLAMAILDTIPPESLRETARQRFAILDGILAKLDRPDRAARDLREQRRSHLLQPKGGTIQSA